MRAIFASTLAALLLFAGVAPAAVPPENPYDVFGRALRPFIHLLSKKPRGNDRALWLKARLESGTDLPEGLAGLRATLALQAPDHFRLQAPYAGEEITLCRAGDTLWAVPGARLEALLAAATGDKKLPKVNKKFRLEPLQLPLPEKQLIFLPALFSVKDAGTESVEGESCRVLDVQLMPEITKGMEPEDQWTGRVWIRRDHRPARLRLQRPGWEITVRVEELEFSPTLPAETWQPPAEDVLSLTPQRFDQFFRALLGKK